MILNQAFLTSKLESRLVYCWLIVRCMYTPQGKGKEASIAQMHRNN
jgi:hypothetical protein